MRKVIKGVGGFDHAQVRPSWVGRLPAAPCPLQGRMSIRHACMTVAARGVLSSLHCDTLPGCLLPTPLHYQACPPLACTLPGPPIPRPALQWRAFSNQHIPASPARQFIDGDLIEQFLDLK